jgi:hypothetical protein
MQVRLTAQRVIGIAGILIWTLVAAEGGPAPQDKAELIPPAVAPEQNAAGLYMEAIDILEAEPVWGTTLAELAAMASTGYQQNPLDFADTLRIPDEGNRQALIQDVLDEFSRHLDSQAVDQAFAVLTKAAALPHCRFDIDYGRGAAIPLPHLAKLRNLGRFLSAASHAFAEHREAEDAWECVRLQFRLVDHLRDEPFLISQLVRLALLNQVLTSMQDVAAKADIPAARQPQLAGWLDQAEDRTPWINAIHGERLFLGEWLFAGTPQEVSERFTQMGGKALSAPPSAKDLETERDAYRQTMLLLAESMEQPYYQARNQVHITTQNQEQLSTLGINRLLLPGLDAWFRKTAECQALVRIARIGLLLEKHRTEHGSYPACLADADLTPLSAEQQTDPFTGQPFRYRRGPKGIVLYSPGPDDVDNGGQPRLPGMGTGWDLTWQVER